MLPRHDLAMGPAERRRLSQGLTQSLPSRSEAASYVKPRLRTAPSAEGEA